MEESKLALQSRASCEVIRAGDKPDEPPKEDDSKTLIGGTDAN